MKPTITKGDASRELACAFCSLSSSVELLRVIRNIFEKIYNEEPLKVRYQLELVETESLRGAEFYQAGPELSEFAIEIRGPNYCEYIWRDGDDWLFSDALYTANELASKLCNAPIFNQVPESVKDLRFLLIQNYWNFISGQLPHFGGGAPKDQLEVESWDYQNVLVGGHLENLVVMSRAEWDELTDREIQWLK